MYDENNFYRNFFKQEEIRVHPWNAL
jgi:hypothetical protein